jgi:predicted RNase H-like HicB family nuclease
MVSYDQVFLAALTGVCTKAYTADELVCRATEIANIAFDALQERDAPRLDAHLKELERLAGDHDAQIKSFEGMR